MLSENWKTLLDYKSECNIKNIASVDRACVCLFWVVKLFHVRLQNNPHFCVFKYARAVKQKVWNEAENRERDWGETQDSYATLYRFLYWFWEKKPTVLQSSFTLDLWQTTSASTTRQWEIQKQRFGRQYTVYFFFSRLFKHSKQGSSYRGWIYMERSEGKQKLLPVSGRFELPGVKLQ